ncbi:MAG: hypothetical protein Q9207_005679 [Kuettlingeria erythrocarpa]
MLRKLRACGVKNGSSRQESTELAEVAAKTKPSGLSYDDLCGEVQETLKKCDAAKTAHAGKKSAKAAASAYKFGCTISLAFTEFEKIYRSRRDEKMHEEGEALQNLLKPVFGGIADFLNASTDYYERSESPIGNCIV